MTRRKTKLQLTVPQLFNEAQRVSSATGRLRYAGAFWELFAEDTDGTFEQLLGCVKWILKEAERSTHTDRLVLPGGFISVIASQAHEPEQVQLVEALLAELIELSEVDDHIVRWRACQLVQAVMDHVSDDVEVESDVLEELQRALLDRLDDAKPAVRAAAAKAVKRLPALGEDGDYDDCPVTAALLEVLASDKSKEVRKAVVASLPLMAAGPQGPKASTCTLPHILARTLDEADEVRKVAYLALKYSVPLKALAPEERLLVLQRGLADRKQTVADAATSLLEHWLREGCGGDVLVLLSLLDVVQHTDEAAAVVRALIASGQLNAMELCKEAAESGSGLRRDFSQSDTLLSPGEALLWRVLCEELYGDATSKGLAAATAAGTVASIEAAAAGERYSALEGALPASAQDMVAIIALHAQAGEKHRFATCQLMLLAGTCMDFADATSRRAAAAILHHLLTKLPSEQEEDGEGSVAATALQLGSAWRQALGRFLRKVHAEPAELADALLTVVGQLATAAEQAGEGGADATTAWLQALGAAALLLDLLPDARAARHVAAEFSLLDLLHRVVIPAMRHDDLLVRREAVRCLGLYSLLDHIPSSLGNHVDELRSALISWNPNSDNTEVATVAAQALGDLALRKGIKHLDGFLQSSRTELANPTRDQELIQQPLLDVLLGVLQHWENGLEGLSAKAKRAKDGRAGLEAKLHLGAAIAEALARLVLHNNSINLYDSSRPLGLEDSEVLKVLVRLIMLKFDPVTEPATRLQQCLPVFFDTYAAMPLPRQQPCSQQYLSTVLLQAAHCAAQQELVGGKRITAANCMSAKVMRFVLQLLETPTRRPDGEEQQLGHEELAGKILAEVIDCCGLAVPKPYLATLCKLPLRLPVLARPETQASIKAARALAERAQGLLADRLMRKDMEAVAERFAKLDALPAEPLGEEDIAILLESIRQHAEGDEDYQLPFEVADAAPATGRGPTAVARGKAPATRGRGRHKGNASSSEGEEESAGEEEGEQPSGRVPKSAAPLTATRRMPARSTRVTRKLVEASEESDSDPSSDSSSQSEGEEEAENASAAAAAGKTSRRASSDSVSALRQALRENRIA